MEANISLERQQSCQRQQMSKTMENEIEKLEPLGSDALFGSWTPITERLPKVGRRVLVCCQYTDRRLVTIAKWQPAKTIDGQFWDDYPAEWEDADEDTITNPTDLWVEYPLEIEQCGFVENVTHWMPLPSLLNSQDHPPL
jgi:hypothetical protein